MKFYHITLRDNSVIAVSADDIIAAIEWAMLSHSITRGDIVIVKEME